jgi:genome maintenance exonuclease 1
MKFNYPEIETTNEFDLRWYHISENEAFPSITSVLGRTEPEEVKQSLENWRRAIGEDEADRITEEAATNGTSIHLLLELFLKGEPINQDEFTEHQLGGFKSLKIKLKNINEVWGQEVALFSRTLMVAGRCDCVGVYNGTPCIIDFKTSRRIKDESKIEGYKYQLAFYAQAHNEMFGTKIDTGIILMATADGFPLEFRVDLNKYFDKLKSRVSNFYNILLKE